MMSDTLKLFAKLFLVITVVFTVISYLIAIVLEPALFYFTPEGLSASTLQVPYLPVCLPNITVRIPLGLDFGEIFFGLWSIFTLSFLAAWKIRENFHTVIKESIVRPTRKLFSSCLFAMPIINSMTLIVVVAINSIQEAGGIPTGTSPIHGEPFLDFFELSYSAVVEELGFRLVPIGAFLVIYLFIFKKKEVMFSLKQKIKLFFAAILFPDKAKRMAGAKTVNEHGLRGGISISEWGMLIFTSLVFGLAHFNPGVSWELGKISSAAVAGLVIGLSYLVYGAQASIIAHWFFNVYIDTYFLLSEIYPNAAPLANAAIIISFFLGIFGWVVVATLGYLKLVRAVQNRQNQATPSLTV
jgi:hypothetical protein